MSPRSWFNNMFHNVGNAISSAVQIPINAIGSLEHSTVSAVQPLVSDASQLIQNVASTAGSTLSTISGQGFSMVGSTASNLGGDLKVPMMIGAAGLALMLVLKSS